MKTTRIALLCLIVGSVMLVLPKHVSAVTKVGNSPTPPPATPNQ